MIVFVDTSAFYALLDRDDANHSSAAEKWEAFLSSDTTLLSTNYILVECAALVQSRFGVAAARAFTEDVVPLLRVEWIDGETHGAAVGAWLAASRRTLSLVDCASFEVMRRRGIRKAFSFDDHFRQQGFACLP
jgi:predicted nucleic acid-binding protein